MIYETRERCRRAKEVFLEMLEALDTEGRGQRVGDTESGPLQADGARLDPLLDRHCGKNAELRSAVGGLLEAHLTPDPMLDAVDDSLDHLALIEPLESGETVGRYRVERLIGEGGMGLVYRAHQSLPMERTVALKILKPGLDTRELLRRFRVEQQALARLEHPHIARVLDAGQTENGRSFFVMEFVDGVPLTEYCDHHRLNLWKRLELFRSLCSAVAFAHQKGIIHRDLKPNNVLVTEQHGESTVKVIDFGLAKAIDGSLGGQTRLTRAQYVVGTPPYMSPEQANPDQGGIDTRADVYALGAILRELLTGIRPSEADITASLNRRSSSSSLPLTLGAMRPSRAVAKLPEERQHVVANSRSTDPKRLAQRLRGDLDWVVLKATASERERRYDAVATLSRDVTRYLTDEPIEARPPSRRYEWHKWIRRHRAAALVILTVVVATLAITAVSLYQARIARRAEHEAAAALRRARRAQATNRELLYASDIRLAAQSLDRGDVGEAAELLDRHRPGGTDSAGMAVDPRGLEWFYLMRRTKRDRQVLKFSDSSLHGVAVRPDRKQLAVAGDGPTVYQLDVESLEPASSILTGLNEIDALAYSPDGEHVAVGGDNGKVEVWALAEATLASRFAFSEQRVIDFLFSPDGSRLIVSGAIPEVRLFDWRSGERVGTLAIHQRSIETLALSRDGAWLACGSDDSTVSVWDWHQEQLLHRTGPSNGRITAVDFSPDGRQLFDASVKGRLRATETARWRPTGEAKVPSAVQSIAVSPDGRELAVGCRTGIAHRFRLADAAAADGSFPLDVFHFLEAVKVHEGRIHDLAWLDARQPVSVGRDGTLVVLRGESDDAKTASGAALANQLAVSHDGRRIATHDYEQVQVVDAATGEVVPVVGARTDSGFAGIAFTPDDEALLVATADGNIAQIKLGETQRVTWRDAPVAADFAAFQFSADGRRLMLFSRSDSVAVVVEYPSWERRFQAECPDAYAGSLSSDGRYLATSCRGDVRVFEVDSRQLVAESQDHHGETINDIRFGPRDDWIATTSDDRAIKIWNPWDGKAPQLIGVHPEGVPRGLSISSDGRTLLTDSKNAAIWAWSVPAKQKLFPIAKSSEGFWFSELSAKDRLLAYVEVGGRLRWLAVD